MRTTREFILKKPQEFKEKLLEWSRQFEEIAWLDSNEYDQSQSDFDAVLAVQAFTVLKTDCHNGFSKLQEYQEVTKDWIFGYLSYDLKNDVEQLSSRNYDNLHFPDLYFFQPARIIQLQGEKAIFRYLKMVDDEMDDDFEEINKGEFVLKREENSKFKNSEIQPRISKDQYLRKVKDMLSHIHRGDIYEANFCQEFFAENRTI
ncbi:MAG: aminodeoxychorismate synthase component I, partial [Gillisia sp.]